MPNNVPPLAESRQLLVVQAPTWESTCGQLQRYARASVAGPWQAFGPPIPVSLGRSGLAWGRGRHGEAPASPRHKQEGDGCAPAGIFAITALFAYDGPESATAQAARLPYFSAHAALKCIDDPASRYYNQIIDQSTCCPESPVDWTSHEDMLRPDERYAIGAVVAHNPPPALPGGGSCIFLHVWEHPGAPTAGCTAAALADMTEICRWLDGAAQPLLVQLPASVYQEFRAPWALP